MSHEERLRRVADEYWQPTDLQRAVEWSLNRMLSQAADVKRQQKRIDELERLTLSQAERIAAQSELLGNRAERAK